MARSLAVGMAIVLAACGAVEPVASRPADLEIVDVVRSDEGLTLSGAELERGQRFALIGDVASGSTARVAGPSTIECDHCPSPRWRAGVVGPAHGEPGPAPWVAVGPVAGPFPRATASRVDVILDDAWSREIAIDLDGDGAADLERVARCGARIRSGCDGWVCGRVCRATRAVGSSEVRGLQCRGLMPDLEDCERGADAP